MIQFDGVDSRCVKRNCTVQFGLFKKVLLLNEKKLCLWINEVL